MNTSSRYRSQSQILVDELQNLIFTESSQSELQMNQRKTLSKRNREDLINDLESNIDYLKDKQLQSVNASNIFLRGNVSRTSMYYDIICYYISTLQVNIDLIH